ncbi:hypothetical protein [Lactococcus lactis]|uniref:hypothetical protein n=1 Tax=Lactococcus lactis TaxID=1358 RepID=UPI002905E053|nr:hypothetical protein [Lactococcus lactis]
MLNQQTQKTMIQPAVTESGTNNQATSNVNSGNNTYVPNTPNTGGGSNTASNVNSGGFSF